MDTKTVVDAESLLTSTSVLEFTLQSAIVDGRMAFVGVGGILDGIINPDLLVQPGQTVYITLINGDGMPHDLQISELGFHMPMLREKGATATASFTVSENQMGSYSYYCTVSGHRQAGMEGQLVIVGP
jgi:nitrite reductase (NO-forming)